MSAWKSLLKISVLLSVTTTWLCKKPLPFLGDYRVQVLGPPGSFPKYPALGVFCLSTLALLFLRTCIVGTSLLHHCFCPHVCWQQLTGSRWTWPRGMRHLSPSPLSWQHGLTRTGMSCYAFSNHHSRASPLLVFEGISSSSTMMTCF